ncbi:PREDICTED: deleted in autism protein 1 homolog [Eufriesea mexicana]|uniref:deleted in autism protein 1 homolog n=1 Tax=Eufriesea mexicana TaxID=516756 RepID=UPI00083C86EA|nr:PREDICTED: deleted in autism protein 1 homolog [Eufriesea mexicana]
MYNILKFRKCIFLSPVTISIVLKWFVIITFRPDMNRLTELHKCPVCFGVSACNYIHEVDIILHDFYTLFAYFYGVKNVFFGSFNKSSVVLKKLAQNFELDEFDKMLCKDTNFSHICTINVKEVEEKTIKINFHKLIEEEVSSDFMNNNFNRLKLCPTIQHLNDLLKDVYYNMKDVNRKILDINIWVLTLLNPEPLLLQILPADKDWPVPKYFGACGRIIVEEYVGLPLATYYNEPWLHRAKIASSLLDAAYKFTYKNENFGFYLTDISADNIAVDLNNNAKFVDLENVIVVDKNAQHTERLTTWNQLQVNTENFSCSECLAFSYADICNHKISDHNFYAICKVLLALNLNNNIFPGGFLHDIPTNILKKHPDIQHLIQQCVNPQTQFNRIIAGMQLKNLLDIVIQNQT